MKLEKCEELNRRLQEELEVKQKGTVESPETFYGSLAMMLLSYKKLLCQIAIMLMYKQKNNDKENNNE